MTTETARRTLKVSPNASMDEIRAAYRRLAKTFHPDKPGTGDANAFVLISTAYYVLQGKSMGIMTDDERNDFQYALSLREQIQAYFQQALHEFAQHLEQIETRSRSYVDELINSATSFSELRSIVNDRLANYLTDTVAEIRSHLAKLDARMRHSDDDFIFKIFDEMYSERRRYWLLGLYKNPVTVLEIVGLSFLFLLRHSAELQVALPGFASAAARWWLPPLLVVLGVIAIGVQYALLNPRRQFVPPRLSTASIHALLTKHVAENIGTSKGELALGAAFALAAIGTFVLPGIGTLVGAAIGALLGLAGRDLYETKAKVRATIQTELRLGLQQIREQVDLWATSFARDLELATVQSFESNLRRVAALLTGHKLPLRRLSAGRRLLRE